jgi:glutamate formiminotransferase
VGVLECVVNISEGRRPDVIASLSGACQDGLLDVHSDGGHNRSVFTLGGPEVEVAARDLTRAAVATLDLRAHRGVHPRIGVVDVVPCVPLEPPGGAAPGHPLDEAVAARDRFASWAASELGLPCFLYGPGRSLPEVRRGAFGSLPPDVGPATPHPTAGACAVGARPVLVAYNVWLATTDVDVARAIAAGVRGPAVRALGLDPGGRVQVSCNLIDPAAFGPADLFDAVSALAAAAGTAVTGAELVGLVPAAVLGAIPPVRWPLLDLGPDRTIEARLARIGDAVAQPRDRRERG